jgi:hypothetical protein
MRLNKGEGVMFQPGMVGPSTIDLTHDAEYGVPRLLRVPHGRQFARNLIFSQHCSYSTRIRVPAPRVIFLHSS